MAHVMRARSTIEPQRMGRKGGASPRVHKVQNDRYALSATCIGDTDNGTLVELSRHFLLYPIASVFRNSESVFVSAPAPRLTYVTFPPFVGQPRNPIAHHTRSGKIRYTSSSATDMIERTWFWKLSFVDTYRNLYVNLFFYFFEYNKAKRINVLWHVSYWLYILSDHFYHKLHILLSMPKSLIPSFNGTERCTDIAVTTDPVVTSQTADRNW